MYYKKIDGNYSGTELAILGVNLFNELQNNYGITSPAKFFLGKNKEKETSLFTVVDRIEPTKITKENKEIISQIFCHLHETLSRYYLDKLRNEKFFLTDINGATQYVYGNKLFRNKKENKIYLVDTDMYLDNRPKSLLTVVYWLARHAAEDEEKSQIIQNIKIFINEYQCKFKQMGIKDEKRLKQLKFFLEGKKFGDKIYPAIPTFKEK